MIKSQSTVAEGVGVVNNPSGNTASTYVRSRGVGYTRQSENLL